MKSVWKAIASNVSKSSASTDKLQWACAVAQLQAHRGALLAEPRNSDDRRLLKFGYRVYSQADEDGILHELFRRIGEGNRTFIELGSGDGLENNTLFLLVQGWRGLWIEGSARRAAAAAKNMRSCISQDHLRIQHHVVTAANIDRAIQKLSPGEDVSLLSIDLDGNDYHVLQAIRSISPRAIVAEYNAKFPPDVHWVMEYNETHRWDSTDYFGASLKAIQTLLAGRGYWLVGCNLLGTNAVFVRNDLVSDAAFCRPFTAENHYEPPRYYLRAAYQSGFPPGFGSFRSDGTASVHSKTRE